MNRWDRETSTSGAGIKSLFVPSVRSRAGGAGHRSHDSRPWAVFCGRSIRVIPSFTRCRRRWSIDSPADLRFWLPGSGRKGSAISGAAVRRAQLPGSTFQNPANLRQERGLLDTQVAHSFVLSEIWELPFGRGRRFGSNPHPVVNAVLGGWSMGGILTLTTGRPFNITVNGDPANSGQTNRANLVGDPYAVPGGSDSSQIFQYRRFQANQAVHVRQSGPERDHRSRVCESRFFSDERGNAVHSEGSACRIFSSAGSFSTSSTIRISASRVARSARRLSGS